MNPRFLIIVVVFFQFFFCTAQNGKKNLNDTLDIKFLFTQGEKIDSTGLVLKVVYHNTSNRAVPVYEYLDEGSLNDRFYNYFVQMEKLVDGKYVFHSLRT